MTQQSLAAVPNTAIRKFSDPGSTHSIGDRKQLTEDALKLSRHELEKVLTKRADDAGLRIKAETALLYPLMDHYNAEVERLGKEMIPGLADDIRFSFGVINRLSPGKTRYGNEGEGLRFDVNVKILEQHTKYWTDTIADKITRSGGFTHNATHYYLGIEALRELVEQVENEGSSDDVTINLNIEVDLVDEEDGEEVQREEGLDITRSLEVTCSSELMEMREALAAATGPLFQAYDDFHKAKSDLERIPKMMTELDMHATAQRLSDAGGQSLLHSVLEGVNLLLQGQEISGLYLAAPETKTIMGAPDEHGPESTDKPAETPAVEETPAADAPAASEETAEAAAEEQAESGDQPEQE